MSFADQIEPVQSGEWNLTVTCDLPEQYPNSMLFTLGAKDEFPAAWIILHPPELLALLEAIAGRLGIDMIEKGE